MAGCERATAAQLRVLRVLQDSGWTLLGAIDSDMRFAPGDHAVTRLLIGRGLLSHSPSSGAVRITPAGRAVLSTSATAQDRGMTADAVAARLPDPRHG